MTAHRLEAFGTQYECEVAALSGGTVRVTVRVRYPDNSPSRWRHTTVFLDGGPPMSPGHLLRPRSEVDAAKGGPVVFDIATGVEAFGGPPASPHVTRGALASPSAVTTNEALRARSVVLNHLEGGKRLARQEIVRELEIHVGTSIVSVVDDMIASGELVQTLDGRLYIP